VHGNTSNNSNNNHSGSSAGSSSSLVNYGNYSPSSTSSTGKVSVGINSYQNWEQRSEKDDDDDVQFWKHHDIRIKSKLSRMMNIHTYKKTNNFILSSLTLTKYKRSLSLVGVKVRSFGGI
jgi:hypothetical protein